VSGAPPEPILQKESYQSAYTVRQPKPGDTSSRLPLVAADRFLAGVAKAGPPHALINERTQETLASAVEVAGTSESRRRGLLGRDSLDPSAALIIAPCSAIHTFFMRFALDVVFVDRAGRVLHIVRDLPPWRMAASLRAYAVVEMTGGSLQRTELAVGDRLYLTRGSVE
jgi:uncharacterized membrane protein (UPF0127 family)